MPVSARQLVGDFERKLNSLNTFQGQSYQVVDAINILNEAWQVVFENNVKLAEVDSKYRNNLRQLEKKNVKLQLQQLDSNIVFAKYPDDLHTRLGHYVTAKCTNKGCTECKMIVPRITQSDDLHQNRQNPYRKANFSWRQLPMDEAGNGLYLYTDGEMEICEMFVDYYRKISRIEAPSLIKCSISEYYNYDGSAVILDSPFDVDSTYLARKVVDVAVLMAHRDIRDAEGYQTQLGKILALENLT